MEPIKLIPLHQGRAEVWANGAENQSVHLTYDISNHLKAWPDAQPTVAFERADGEKYPHAWELDGPVLHIPLLLADTEIPGMCKCMITMLSGDGRANTVVFYGSVTEGIDSLGEEPADPMLGIIEQVNEDAAEAYQSQQAAKESENAAKESETNAKASEDGAQDFAAAALASEKEAVNAADAAIAAAAAAEESRKGAVNAADTAAYNSNNALQNAAASHEAADAAAASAAEAKEALANMEERYYVPSIDDDGYLHFTPSSADMPEIPPVYVRGPEGPAGGGVVDNLFVIKYSESADGTKTTDRTFQEVKDAIAAGYSPVVFDTVDGSVYSLSRQEDGFVYFDVIVYGNSKLETKRIEIHRDGIVSKKILQAKAENAKSLTFTGAVTATYNGREDVTVNIPAAEDNNVFTVRISDDQYGIRGNMELSDILNRIKELKCPIAVYSRGGYNATLLLSGYSTSSVSFSTYWHSNFDQAFNACDELTEIRIDYYGKKNINITYEKTVKAVNPEKITFTGAVNATYDGGEAVIVNIPEGGSGGSGATPNWEANEGEPGYIENRTHWVERGKGEEDVIYDNIHPLVNAEIGGFTILDAPKRSFTNGETLRVAIANAEFECKTVRYSTDGMDAYIIGNAGAINPDIEMNEIPFVIIILDKPEDAGDGTLVYGLIMIMSAIDGIDTDIALSISAKTDLYHKLDYRYVGTKYKQPEWGVEENNGILVEQQEIEVTYKSGIGQCIGSIDKDHEVLSGNVYTVVFDGVEYTFEATSINEMLCAIGNLGITFPDEMPDTGEPFAIDFMDGRMTLYTKETQDTTHNVSISADMKIVHKIPNDYLQSANAGFDIVYVPSNPADMQIQFYDIEALHSMLEKALAASERFIHRIELLDIENGIYYTAEHYVFVYNASLEGLYIKFHGIDRRVYIDFVNATCAYESQTV